jgi:type IV fimbrial biogenesis protein FimT
VPRISGFTLIELMTVLALAAIVLAAGAPNLIELVRAQQLKAATSDVFSALALARAQAMARNQRVEVVPAGENGTDWASGWTVFVDRDDDRMPGQGDEIISVHGPLARGVSTAFSFTSAAAPHYIAYNGAGRSCSDTNSAAARMGTLSLFDGSLVRRIKINMLGRARICDPARDSGCDGPNAPP